MTKQVHFIMQGKGGVGKTLTSVILTQYLQSKEKIVMCIDTDSVNNSFSRFNALSVTSIPLFKDQAIDPHNFDLMTEKILSADADAVVVDSGASTFVPLNKYIADCELVKFLGEQDCSVCFHTIVNGGQDADDTLNGVVALVTYYGKVEPSPLIALWLNPFHGAIEWAGKSFTDLPVYDKVKDFISYKIYMPDLDKQLFGRDFEQLMKAGQTFDEVNGDSSYTLMAKHRLYTMKNKFFEAIAKAGL